MIVHDRLLGPHYHTKFETTKSNLWQPRQTVNWATTAVVMELNGLGADCVMFDVNAALVEPRCSKRSQQALACPANAPTSSTDSSKRDLQGSSDNAEGSRPDALEASHGRRRFADLPQTTDLIGGSEISCSGQNLAFCRCSSPRV